MKEKSIMEFALNCIQNSKMKFIIEFISNMEFLLLHVEEFCDHFAIILRKSLSLEINVEILLQTGIEI